MAARHLEEYTNNKVLVVSGHATDLQRRYIRLFYRF